MRALMPCPTLCDADCDAPCHEAHQPYWKRTHDPDTCFLLQGRCDGMAQANLRGGLMADLSELTDDELHTHIEWCSEEIYDMDITGQDPVGTDVWEWYLEALDESDRRDTIKDAWRQR